MSDTDMEPPAALAPAVHAPVARVLSLVPEPTAFEPAAQPAAAAAPPAPPSNITALQAAEADRASPHKTLKLKQSAPASTKSRRKLGGYNRDQMDHFAELSISDDKVESFGGIDRSKQAVEYQKSHIGTLPASSPDAKGSGSELLGGRMESQGVYSLQNQERKTITGIDRSKNSKFYQGETQSVDVIGGRTDNLSTEDLRRIGAQGGSVGGSYKTSHEKKYSILFLLGIV